MLASLLVPAPAAKDKGLPIRGGRQAEGGLEGWRATSPLRLTSSSQSLCCLFLATSRAVSPALFTVKGKSRDHGQNQGDVEV